MNNRCDVDKRCRTWNVIDDVIYLSPSGLMSGIIGHQGLATITIDKVNDHRSPTGRLDLSTNRSNSYLSFIAIQYSPSSRHHADAIRVDDVM